MPHTCIHFCVRINDFCVFVFAQEMIWVLPKDITLVWYHPSVFLWVGFGVDLTYFFCGTAQKKIQVGICTYKCNEIVWPCMHADKIESYMVAESSGPNATKMVSCICAPAEKRSPSKAAHDSLTILFSCHASCYAWLYTDRSSLIKDVSRAPWNSCNCIDSCKPQVRQGSRYPYKTNGHFNCSKLIFLSYTI